MSIDIFDNLIGILGNFIKYFVLYFSQFDKLLLLIQFDHNIFPEQRRITFKLLLQMQYRTDAEQFICRTGRIQDRPNAD